MVNFYYSVQVYQDSALLAEKWFNAKTNTEQPSGFTPDSEYIIPGKIGSFPNWQQYSLALMSDPAYNRMITTSTNQLAVRRLESLAISLSTSSESLNSKNTLTTISLFWNQMIADVPEDSSPTPLEIEAWYVKTARCLLPINFDESGLMTIDNE